MQNNARSGNLSGIIAILGLITLMAGLVVMLLLPEIKLSAFGILAFGVALLAIALIIDFRRVRGAVTGRRGRFGLGSIVMVCIVIGITIFLNAISIAQYGRIDTSSLSQFTLTPQTVKVLNDLNQPVKAIGFFVSDPTKDPYNISSYVDSLLIEYGEHTRKLTVQYVDPDQHPDQAKKYDITQYQSVVFESGTRRRTISPSEYIIVDDQGTPAGVRAEHSFTSAILEVTGVAQKSVYFLTGHGEANIDGNYSLVKNGLLDDLYKVNTLSLITNPDIPEDCAVLVIAAPQNSFSDAELKAINDYLWDGGQALILTNPGGLTDVKTIVSYWGVDIGDGTVIDPASCVAPHQDMPLVPASRNYFLLPGVYFPGTVAIIPQSKPPLNLQSQPLVWTSAGAWQDNNFIAGTEPIRDQTEKQESLAIGALVVDMLPSSNGKFTRLAVIGDSDFASNDHFNGGNNGDLFLNTVNWLAEETSLISIRRNVQPFRRLAVTPGQANFIQISSIALLPVLLLIASGVIWWRRR